MERSSSHIPSIVRHLPREFKVLHTSRFPDLFKWIHMVEALYLHRNYELKDNYVSVNHCFFLTHGVWKRCFVWRVFQPAANRPCIHIKADCTSCIVQNLFKSHWSQLTLQIFSFQILYSHIKTKSNCGFGCQPNQLKELKDVETIKKEAFQ